MIIVTNGLRHTQIEYCFFVLVWVEKKKKDKQTNKQKALSRVSRKCKRGTTQA